MSFECQCCICEYELNEKVYYLLDPDSDKKDSIYCKDCISYIHSNRWKIIKEGLLGVDCLAEFKRIRKSGIPLTLLEKDISSDLKSENQVHQLIFNDGRIISAHLEKDITDNEVDELIKDLRNLDINEVTERDIKNIASKYWNTLKKC